MTYTMITKVLVIKMWFKRGVSIKEEIKNDGGTKSTKDYDRESKKKKMQELKNK